jgi:hypothetical protein
MVYLDFNYWYEVVERRVTLPTTLIHRYLRLPNPTNADVKGNAANIDVGDVLLAEHVLEIGVVQLLVVKEGRVRVDLGPETLVNDGALGVDLVAPGSNGVNVKHSSLSRGVLICQSKNNVFTFKSL